MEGDQVMGATLPHGTRLLQSKDKEPGKLLEFEQATVLYELWHCRALGL